MVRHTVLYRNPDAKSSKGHAIGWCEDTLPGTAQLPPLSLPCHTTPHPAPCSINALNESIFTRYTCASKMIAHWIC